MQRKGMLRGAGLLFGVFLTIFVFTDSAQAATGIKTCTELQEINAKLSGDYMLEKDIDCSETVNWNNGAGFIPIGSADTPFTGSFDGKKKVITGLYINRPDTNYVGLFGDVNSSKEISNVGLESVDIKGESHVGALVGHNDGIVANSYSTGTIEAVGAIDLGVGGLVGTNSGIIKRSFSSVDVSGAIDLGGLVGTNFASITDSYATGAVSGSFYIGGFAGYNGYTASAFIKRSYSTGAVSGDGNVGGLLGGSAGSQYITDSFWDVETSGQDSSVGGGTGKTTEEMKTFVTFTDTNTEGLGEAWDFDSVWIFSANLNNGYPHLVWWPFSGGSDGRGGGRGGQESDNDDPLAFFPAEIFQPVQTLVADQEFRIKAQIQRPDAIKMFVTLQGKPHRMYDDGMHADGAKGDLIYSTDPLTLTKSAEYTITTSFFNQITKAKGKIVINEKE